ncbi:MAG: transporter substrate-binding domain-containing protein [Deltaproteobacteria bacterium]|jgi:signal transduction histidine kinase/CheY-like chemotaxis protein|nr:transporter substrate-binding domain-containing protein [Deltaproteobacteria bacterium]
MPSRKPKSPACASGAAFLAAAAFTCALAMAQEPGLTVPGGEGAPAGRAAYLDVPGVTQEEIDAIERVKAARTSLVFANERSSELFLTEDGSPGGAASLLCDWLTEFFGIRFEPTIVPWHGILGGLEDGTVDFTGEMTPMEERRKTYFMTTAIAERTIQYMRLPGARPFSEILGTRPVRYAFLLGSVNFRMARDSVEKPYIASSVSDVAGAWRALSSGEVDAYVAESPVQASFDPYGTVEAKNILPMVTSEVALTARKAELAPFVSVVQKYLDARGRASFRDMYREGYRGYLRSRFLASLSPGELAWTKERAASGKPVLIGLEFDNYPVSFYNEREREFQGVAVDILREVGSLTGLDFRNGHEGPIPWASSLLALENGEISILSELVRTPDREGRYLWTDVPYMRDRYAFLSLTGFPEVNLADVTDLRVGLSTGTAVTELFWHWFPGHRRTITYPNNIEPYGGLERGEVDLVMGTRNELLAMTNYLERPYFKVNVTLEDRTYDSFFGVTRGEPELRSILAKAQALVDTDEIASRWRSRVFDYRGALARARLPLMASGLGLLAVVILLLAVMFVRSTRAGRALEAAVAARTEELRRQIDIAEKASRAKSDFMARTSHEIRTPMNAIIGFSELAQREYGGDKALEYIRGIRSAGASLLTIINDILDFSRIESGGIKLLPARYRAASLVNDALSLIRVRMGDRPVALEPDISPGIPSVMTGDSGRIRQILLNLLSNAVKYTERGRIRFSAKAARTGENEALLTFEVEDTGIGIRSEDMDKLFGEFTRLDEKRNSGVEGTGLGLAIARRLCLAMDGDLTAESVYGKGSLFRARIRQRVEDWSPMGPLAEDPLTAEGRARASFTAPEAELLVVDDYSSNLMVAEGLLAPYAMRLSFASGGLEAVGLARDRAFDLILMDHMMPEMDGIEAMKAIKAAGSRQGPIVALTANAVAGMREMYLEQGFDDFLTKPIDPARLDSLLCRWIPVALRRGPPAPGAAGPGADGERIPVLDGVDVVLGAAMAGGSARYLALLEAFRRDAEGSLPALEIPADEESLARLVVAVHALKTACANICAGPLSARAAALEAAGRHGNPLHIERNLAGFRVSLEGLVESIRNLGRHSPQADGNGGDGTGITAGGDDVGESRGGGTVKGENAVEDLGGYENVAAAGAAPVSLPKGDMARLKAALESLTDALMSHDFPRVDEDLERLQQAVSGDGLAREVEAVADDILVGDYGKALRALEAMRTELASVS